MMRSVLTGLLGIALLLTDSIIHAQQPRSIPRIAYLSGNLAGIQHRTQAFRQGLRELGYVEGKNIVIEWRSAERDDDRYAAVAAELVRLKVDVIVTAGGRATRAAKQATSTISIVMTQDRDPVANGFVASLARPGGNITGMSRVAPQLSGKQLELLKEIVLGLSRVAVFKTPRGRRIVSVVKEIELAAKPLGLKLLYLDVQDPKDFERAFRNASKSHADAALWLLPDPSYNSKRKQVADLAIKSRLPVMYFRQVDVEAGGLMFYGVDFTDLDRRAATYVHKILTGRKPADLPVERPTKFEFMINLNSARQIGLTIPPNVLARADKVIK